MKMEKDRFEVAKELFLKYNGIFFLMQRDNEYDKYIKFNISKQQEIQWLSEHVVRLTTSIKANHIYDWNATSLFMIIDTYDLREALVDISLYIVNNYPDFDTYSLLIFADCILNRVSNFVKNTKRNNQDLFEIKNNIVDILKGLLDKPITIDESYFLMPYNDEYKDPEIIKLRIQQTIMKWSS